MTGGEHQPQQVIVDVIGEGPVEVGRHAVPLRLQRAADLGVLELQLPVPAEQVDRPALGDGHQPGAGIARNPGLRPLLEGGDYGVLSQFLGQADVIGVPGEPGDEPR